MTIHHIDMQKLSSGLFNLADVFTEGCKVRG
jgi:hypothetical protein